MSLALRFGLPRSPARPAEPAARRMAHPTALGRGPGRRFLATRRALVAATVTGAPTAASAVVGTLLSGRVAWPRRRWLLVAALAALVGLVAVGRAIADLGPAAPPTAGQPPASAAASMSGGWPPPSPGVAVVDPLDIGAKLALVGFLLYLALRLLGRLVAPAGVRGGPIVVLASRPLGPKAALHLVAVGERRILVGESPAGIVGLTELTADELEIGVAGLGELETGSGEAGR
jgi:hypothetical protein